MGGIWSTAQVTMNVIHFLTAKVSSSTSYHVTLSVCLSVPLLKFNQRTVFYQLYAVSAYIIIIIIPFSRSY